ncbi:MAG: hypothetical protein R3D30_03420 [Hyphomicrobiales bacterium]
MAEAIEKGGFVAAASFDNGKNLATWEGFHDTLSTIVDEAKEETGFPREVP